MSHNPARLSLDEFIARHASLSTMPRNVAEQTVTRWVSSGRVQWVIDPEDGHKTIDRKYLESEEERQRLNDRRAAGQFVP